MAGVEHREPLGEPAAALQGRLAADRYPHGDSFSPLDDFFDREEILTSREREVLHRIAQGRPNKEIADELHISIHTVNTHRQRILAKLGVDNSLEAVKYAWILGILDA